MATPRYWSVERDGDTVVATCPEPLGHASDARPGWMVSCAAAIRDELRLLEIPDGTLLAATLAGALPEGRALEDVLLAGVGIPRAQVHAGLRLRATPRSAAGISLRYVREPIGGGEREESGALVAAVRVPIADGQELGTAGDVRDATRAFLEAPLSAARVAPSVAPSGGFELRLRLSAGTARRAGSVELVHKLLEGVRASLGTARVCAAEVVFVPGGTPQLEIELRSLPVVPGA